jgi:II/X family phage/plasmid replication protein
MVDWVTASFISPEAQNHVSESFDTGRIMKVAPTGEVVHEFASRTSAVGSYDASMSFRAPYSHQLEMSGNAVKFLQGHNLFGSSDPLNQFFAAGLISLNSDSPFPCPPKYQGMLFHDDGRPFASHTVTDLRFTRLDLTRSYKFDSNAESREWLRSVAGSGHSRHRNSLMTNATMYFGKTSRRWSMKIYQKFDEITSGKAGHELSNTLTEREQKQLTEWAEGIVRFEITLRRPEIEKIQRPFNALEIWQEYYLKVEFNRNEVLMSTDVLDGLNLRLRSLVGIWQQGADLRKEMTKPTFYRTRREILSKTGIDIAEPKEVESKSQIVELMEINWDPQPVEELLVEIPDAVTIDYLGNKPSIVP